MAVQSNNINMYPSSESAIREYKINSEKNLTSIIKDQTRNRIINPEDMSLSSNGLNIYLGPTTDKTLKLTISGYLLSITKPLSVVAPSAGTYRIYLKLFRNDTGDKNLVGTSGTTDEIYGGISLLAVSSSSTTDLAPDQDVLIIGTITVASSGSGTVNVLARSKTRLRAQDIYVYGSTNGTSTDDPLGTNGIEDDPEMGRFNGSATLDQYLCNLVISDGQF